jgi:sugar phosphate isomerase/epimerase
MRYAICNETFGDWDFAQVCAIAAEHGYTGIEMAPFTLAERITDVSAQRRRELYHQAESAGLSIVGLHWLLAKTEGFQVTSPDAEVRRRTAEYLGELARCCRDLGGSLMVFGSPQQRRVPGGYTLAQATDFALDTFQQAAPILDEVKVKLALEPLAPAECDFLTTCAEANGLLDRLNHPNFALHLDVKAMTSESTPIPELIAANAGRVVHFHANDANRRGPGFGEIDFRPIMRALDQARYSGWVSVEVFDYSPDPITIARESIRYLRQCEFETKNR